jgi:hypothetical protein
MSYSDSPLRTLILTSAVITVVLVCALLWESPQSAQEHSFLPDKFAAADEVTLTIRDRSTRLFAVRVEDGAARKEAETGGRVIADHGSFVLVAASGSEENREGWQPIETTVNLPGATFDPLSEVTVDAAQAFDSGSGYYIVQFGVTPTDELLDSLKSAGVEVIQYVPHQAFFVYGKGDAISRVAGHSRVRWVGRYLPSQKPSTVLRAKIADFQKGRNSDRRLSPIERTARNRAVFDVAVFANADIATAATSIALVTGGKVRRAIPLANNFFNIVRIEAPIDRIESAGEVEAVFSIEAWSQPKKEDEIASHIVAGNYTGNTVAGPGYDPLSQFGVNGLNTTVAVVDDGVGIPGDGGYYITENNAIDGPMRGATPGARGHGHLQASIIAGDVPFAGLDANGYNYGSGIAPKAHIVNIPFLRVTEYTGSDADAVDDTVKTEGPNGVRAYISNNSWGDGTNWNEYDLYAAEYDGFVRDASADATIDPLVIVFSAGNQGFSGLTRPKVAKNVISVAATENIRPTQPTSGGTTGVADNIEQVPDFSSRGPAADTRIKPDIAAPGAAITGGRSGPGILGMSIVDDYHRVSSGTSHAAPLVAGAAALFTEFWKNNNSGVNPSPAMVKAALINGAVEVTGQGASDPRPNGAEGWGRVNLKNVLNTGTAMSYFDQNIELGNVGAIRNFTGAVSDNSRPLRISLVWTDPPAAGDPALVNDLDLEVLVGGNKYKGNVFSAGMSAAGGSADNRNNLENVFLPAGVSGPVTIRVITKALNGNGILGNADATDQNFALVVYNANVTESSLASPEGGEPSVITGNNVLEPNECNLVSIPVTNFGASTATSVTATLTTTTPGVTINIPNATYPNIAPGATANSVSPFQVSTANTLACATNVDLVLTVSYAGMAAPAVFSYTLAVGAPPPDPNYVFTSTNGATISPGGTLIAGSDADEVVLDVPAPFAFSVYDTAVASGSNIRVSDNGHIRIETSGSATAADVNSSLPTSAGGAFPGMLPVLMPYWDDLDMRPDTLTGGGIYSEVTGSPGSRTWKLEWRARNWRAPQLGNVVNVQFAVYFHENSNDFEYVYALTGGGPNSSGALATVGVQGAATGSLFTQHSFDSASLSSGLRLAASRPAGECTAGFGPCVSTAAPIELSGRVEASNGRGIRGVNVALTGSDGVTKTATTNTFGYFRIDGVPAGNGYVLTVSAKGYRFAPLFFDATDSISDLVLTAEP